MLPFLETEKLFQSKKWTDITLKVGGKELKCHKVVLGSRCEYFAKLLDPDSSFAEAGRLVLLTWLERTTDDVIRDVIELHDDVPYAVEAMVRWLYTGRMRASGEKNNYTWHFYFDLMQVADKYLLTELASEALDMFDTKARGLHEPREVLEIIDAIRSDGNAGDLDHMATDLECRHFQSLVGIPAYFESLTPERLQELWRLTNKEKDLVQMWVYKCEICEDRKLLSYRIPGLCCKETDHGNRELNVMTEKQVWMRREDLY